MGNENTQRVLISDDFNAAASHVSIQIGAVTTQIASDIPVQISIVANGNVAAPQAVSVAAPADISTPRVATLVAGAPRLLEVGEQLEDGTTCMAVDDRHDDWRRITDEEGSILAQEWLKVARGRPAEDYWLFSTFGNPESLQGQVRRGGEGVPMWITDRDKNLWVPVVRAGSAYI